MSVSPLIQLSAVSSITSARLAREDSVYSSPSKGPLKSLNHLFKQFAKLYAKEHNSASLEQRKLSRKTNVQDDDVDEPKIGLSGVEAWFQKAKILTTPITNVTVYDVRNQFWKGDKLLLTYKEFEHFLEELAKFKKIHPDVLLLRLRFCGEADFEDRIFHYTVPEGSADRALDAFRLNTERIKESFINLSSDRYEEPICFGGVRGLARKSKSQKEEEAILISKAKELMKKGEPTNNLDALNRNFVYFAKNGNYFSDGRSIELTQLIKWLKQAEIIDGETVTAHDIGFLFKRLYTLTWQIYLDDLHQFFHELSLWKNIPEETFLRQLRSCQPPASSSMSVVDITIPESMLEVLKDILSENTEDLQKNLELFEPKSQDTPYGHTPNSRNRHFQDAVDEDMVKVHATIMDDLKKKGAGGQTMMNMHHQHHHSHKPGENDDKDDTFPEEKRGGKDYLTKRWNDAYPIGGMDGGHRPHMEQDLDKLMFGADRADDSSSDDEERVKKKIKAKYGMVHTANSIANQPIVPLEEQFEKYKRFGDQAHEQGITLHNIQLWFSLAGMIAQGITLYTIKDIEEKFNSYRFAREQGYMDLDTFLSFLTTLSEKSKKHTNAKEIRERLARSGPPRALPLQRERKLTLETLHKRNSANNINQSKQQHEEATEFEVSDTFKQRYQEFARFGEATVHDAYTIAGISMLNANKWVKQSGLEKKGVNIGDVDVLYKQLFPSKQRISIQEFCKVILALANNTHGLTLDIVVESLTATGPPAISEIQHHTGTNSKSVTRQPSKTSGNK